jgi:Flp pilus assembly protein TadG
MAYNFVDRLRKIRHDERGFSLVFVGLGFMAMLSASMLAIDVGMFMNARAQAQNAADSGAHAGAVALAFNSFTDHTANGPAVKGAINAAQTNLVAGVAPSVIPADVTFPFNAATGQFDQVQVTVYRTTARGNPLDTLIGRFFNHPTADIGATATAQAAPANAEDCVLPFTIPDKWIDKNCAAPPCEWKPDSTFDAYDKSHNPIANPDVYIPPGTTDATGYSAKTDKGVQLVLKNNNQDKTAPSFYNPWDLPGSVGGDDYRDNIGGCNSHLAKIGDNMTPENGNMVGPTKQGTDDLIALDPNAHWDLGCNCVKGSDPKYATSPRIRVLPLYDPMIYETGQQTGKSGPQLKIVNYLGFFIEDITGAGEVTGRISPISGKVAGNGPAPIGAFPMAVVIVK